MRRLVFAVAISGCAIGCGRVGFDALDAATTSLGDAPVTDAPPLAIAVVQATGNSVAGGTIVATFPMPVEAGDVVVAALDGSGLQVPQFTDSLGDSYAFAIGPVTEPIGDLMMAYAVIGTTGPCTVTATLTSGTGAELRVHEIRGLSTAGTLDTGSTASGVTAGTATPPQEILGPAIVTSGPREMVFAFELAGIATAGTESTLALAFDSDITEYELAPTAGTYQPTAMLSNGPAWAIIAASFRGQ